MNKKKQVLKILNEWEKDFKVFGRSLPFDKTNLEEVRKYAKLNAEMSMVADIREESKKLLKLIQNLTQEEYQKFFD